VPSGKKAYGCAALSTKDLENVAADLRIGVGELSGSDAGKNWHGEIGCVRIYDRSLSQEEIVQNYIGTHRRFPAPIPQNIPYYDRSIQRPFGDLMAFTEGTLSSWVENNGWWNVDDGDGWTFNHAAGEFVRSSSVLRVDDDAGIGQIRVALELNNYDSVDAFYALYPKSFCRAIIGNNYYYLPVQESPANGRQFFWEPVNSLNWTKENIRDNGNFGWNPNTSIRIEIWSG